MIFIEAERNTGRTPFKCCLDLPESLLLVAIGDITSHFKTWLQLDALLTESITSIEHNPTVSLCCSILKWPGLPRDLGHITTTTLSQKKFLLSLTTPLNLLWGGACLSRPMILKALKPATNSGCWAEGNKRSKTCFQHLTFEMLTKFETDL